MLPAGVTLVSATATIGTAVANTGTNTVTWNGGLPNGGSVAITIEVTVDADNATGATVSNQGTINFERQRNERVECALWTIPASPAPTARRPSR